METCAQAADLARTQEFLSNLGGVVGAQVWISGSKILARVEVQEWSELSDADLRSACQKKLGSKLTPALLMLERTRGEKHVRTA